MTWMEIRLERSNSGWKSDQMHGIPTDKKTAIFELPYFAQESILVAQKAYGHDGP